MFYDPSGAHGTFGVDLFHNRELQCEGGKETVSDYPICWLHRIAPYGHLLSHNVLLEEDY